MKRPHFTLKNITLQGAGTGFDIKGPVDIEMENVTFDRVKTPFDVSGAASIKVSGTRIINDPQIGNGNSTSDPSKPPLPVFCSNCKTIFPSRNYKFSSTQFSASNNEEPCPECGWEHAKLSERIFNLAGDVVRVLSAPDITHAMLAAIKRTADKITSREIGPNEAIKELTAINPELGRLAKKARSFGKSAFWALGPLTGLGCLILSAQQTDLSNEQAKIAREQLALQQQTSSQPDPVERLLHEFSTLMVKSNGVFQYPTTPKGKTSGKPPQKPTKGKPIAKRKTTTEVPP